MAVVWTNHYVTEMWIGNVDVDQALLVVYLEMMSQPTFYQGQIEVALFSFGEEMQMI